MKSVKIIEANKAEVVTNATLDKTPRPDELLVKTVAVALNPADWKHIGYGHAKKATIGCDFSGVVEEIGSEVTRFRKGDRVWGMVTGSNQTRPDNGAFQEYVYVKTALTVRIPDHLSFEDAASLGVGVVTCGQGMYQEMPLAWPDSPLKEKVPILIWGGSSATGALGIQFAKLSGYEVVTTAGKHNFDYVTSLGADAVFDSRSSTVGEDIRAYTHDKLYYAWDTIGAHGSAEAIAKALASTSSEGQGLYYGTIVFREGKNTFDPRPEEVVFSVSMGFTATGESWAIGNKTVPALPDHYEFARKWMSLAGEIIADRKIKPHRIEMRKGGLDGILSGLEDLRNGKVSGAKLVYRVAGP